MESQDKPKKQVVIANGVVQDNEERVLLVKRKREWDEQSHDKWELPGGKVEFAEDPKKTAMREVEEETGYEVENPKLVPRLYSHHWEYDIRESHVIIVPFACDLVGGEIDTSDKNISEVDWFKLDEIRDLKVLPGTLEVLEKAFESI